MNQKNLGAKLYALRTSEHLTQQDLSMMLHVTPAAVSKWERGHAIPDIDLLCQIADQFHVTLDALLGRDDAIKEVCNQYEASMLKRFLLAEEIVELSILSRNQGLLAMEERAEKSQEECPFLVFAVHFTMERMRQGMEPELITKLLSGYARTLSEDKRLEGEMIVDTISIIFAGEHEDIVREVAASYVGMEYQGRLFQGMNHSSSREEIMQKVFQCQRDNLGLLDPFEKMDDFAIQMTLRMVNNEELMIALVGTTQKIAEQIMNNISDRLLPFLIEDMRKFNGTEQEIKEAEQRMIECAVQIGAIKI